MFSFVRHVASRLRVRLYRMRWTRWCWLALLGGLSSCCSPAHFPKVDTSGPGWTLQQGEMLWKPRKKYPELAGEVVIASNVDGRQFVQFTKTTFPMATAQCTLTNWAIYFPPQKMAFCGRGEPPSRFGWLQLLRALRHDPLASPWQFQSKDDGSCRLENPRTGESLAGFLAP